jgi:predicted transcriptional regulator
MTKCAQDSCPIAKNMDMTRATPAEKKDTAKGLYAEGWTMERIAERLGVTKMTISNWLANCKEPLQLKRAKSASNPKGAGRPKGRKKPEPRPGEKQIQVSVNVAPEDWEQYKAKADEAGMSAAAMLGAVIAEPEIDHTTLSMTAQQKLDAAIKQRARVLAEDFDARVLAEVERRLDAVVLPAWKETIDWAEAVRKRDKGILTAAEYRLLRSCLHPDRVLDSAVKRKFEEAFGIIERLEKFLCEPEKEPPAKFPRSWQEAQSLASEQL